MKTYKNLGQELSEADMREYVESYYARVFSKSNDRHVQMQELFPEKDEVRDVLDFGCGMGGISKLFADVYDTQVRGIDISENELDKAKLVFGDDERITFQLLEEFEFPEEGFDLVFSAMVAEHVHNPGLFLARINRMLRDGKYLIVGIPNVGSLSRFTLSLLFSRERARKHSREMIEKYDKAHHHINAWDTIHFTNLAASCGFELVDFLPTEGIPLPWCGLLRKVPVLKWVPEWIKWRVPLFGRWSYSTFYLFKKRRFVDISPYA